MLGYLLAPLRDTLRPHFNLSKTRLATMAIILFGLANGRTVSLSHLASQFPGKALHASNYRRLQHFFKQVQFDEAVVARFIVSLLNIKGPVILAVDRTNWKLGVNLLSKLTLFCRPIMPHLRDGRTVGEEPQPDQPAGRTIPILSMQIIPDCLSIAAR